MRLAIIVQNGTRAGTRLELTEGFLTVGRGKSCNLIFDPTAENMVSTKHCYIETKPDGFYLIDNKSTNGTFVNGIRIQVIKLNSGDMIQFGKNGPEARIAVELQSAEDPETIVRSSRQAQNQNTWALNAQSSPTIVPQQVQQFSPPLNPPPPPVEPVQYESNSNQMLPTQMGNWGQPQAASWGQQFQSPQMVGSFADQPTSMRNSFSYIGLGNQQGSVKPDQTGRYIGLAAIILLAVFLSLIIVALIISDVGLNISVFASVIAFVPAVLYIIPLMGLDRYDPEPPWLLASAFAWGALVAIVISYFVNSGVGIFAYLVTGNEGLANLASTVVSAPIFEEGTKGFGLLLILLCFRKYFDDILDGIVYGGVIALGFATVENVFYYGRGYKEGGLATLGVLLLMRGILSPFAHVTFTSMTGIGCGISRESHKGFVKFIMPIFGYICAVALHATWNGMSIAAFLFIKGLKFEGVCTDIGLGGKNIGYCAFTLGYTVLQIPLFLAFVGFAFYVMRRQNRILKEMLAIDVARGVIPQEHLDIATSALRSTIWVYGSIFSGKFGKRSKYLRAVGKLGLSYWHIQRATAAQGQTASFQQNPILREEVLKWRDQVS